MTGGLALSPGLNPAFLRGRTDRIGIGGLQNCLFPWMSRLVLETPPLLVRPKVPHSNRYVAS